MTDQIDYTQKPEVLKACGWKWVNCADPQDDGYWEDAKGELREDMFERHPITMQELWEGLCKACKDAGHRWNPEISGMAAVIVNPNDTDGRGFVSSEYGTLNNAVAAALHWVLQQREG